MAEEVGDNQDESIEEAVHEFLDAQSRGRKLNADEFVKQYPGLEDQIRRRILNLRRIDTLFDSLVQADEADFDNTSSGQDLVGRKVGSFEIAEMIGRGGMGVVYLARDTKLDRSVAIKSMPAELRASSTAQARFKREARLLASLNHPNIAVIHDIVEQEEGASYLVLEYVPGQTLAQRIAHKPLTLDEALSIGQQIAEAVSAAHDKGVVHRDLKPSNIKITPEGKVKVLDFGLAKAFISEDNNVETTVTQPGRVMGTPAYMSPEQACGKPTDKRSDIWSFGCLMYEMLTGHLPFEGETATEILARIIEREPDWEVLAQEIPMNIRTLLRRCLEKKPQRRLRDIGDAAIEIEETLTVPATATATRPAAPLRSRWRLAAVVVLVAGALVVLLTVVRPNIGPWREKLPGRIESLAVLPLENLTGDPNQEHLADGITGALITDLGGIDALQVRSRTSIMQYKGLKKPMPETGRDLKADAVVEGSVMRVGQQVRVEVRLIHAPTDTRIWGNSYQRRLGDVPILLGEVVRTIAREIEITLTPDLQARLSARRSGNSEAYDTYFMGMFHLHKRTPEGSEKGLDYLQQAIEKDPTDPLPYAGLALGYSIIGHGPAPLPEAWPRARAAAVKALELDDTLAEAHAALAEVKLYYDWDWAGAERDLRRALKLNPNFADAHAQYAWYLVLLGRLDEGLAEMKRAQKLDLLQPIYTAWLGRQYWWAGQDEKAIDEARKSLELNPDFPVGLCVLGDVYAAKGMYEEAIELHQKARSIAPNWGWSLGHTYALAGQRDEALKVLADLGEEYQQRNAWGVVEIYAALGEKDEAFRCLEAGYKYRHNWIPWMARNRNYEPLRDDPRFQDLLRRMNVPE